MRDSTPDPILAELPWPTPPDPTPKVRDEIRRACTADLRPATGMSSRTRVALTLTLAAAVIGILSFLALGKDRPSSALHAALFGAAGWGIVQLALVAFGLGQAPGRRFSPRTRLAVALGLPVAFIGYLTLAASSWLPMGEFFRSDPAGGAVGCGLHALLFGAIAAGGTLWLWRRTDPFTPGLSGAFAGLVGGLTGATAIGVACPSGETWHLWVGHGATVALLALAGALLGRRVLTP